MGREKSEMMLQLEEERCVMKTKMSEMVKEREDKNEMEDIKEKYKRLEDASRELETTISVLQLQTNQEQSPWLFRSTMFSEVKSAPK